MMGKSGMSRSLPSRRTTPGKAGAYQGPCAAGVQPHDLPGAAEELARQTNSEVVQVIGSRFVLYRKKKKDPKIVLPR